MNGMIKTELLTILGSVFDELEINYEYETIGTRNVLVVSYTEDESTPIDCTLTIEDLGEDQTALQFFVLGAIDLDKSVCTDLLRLLPQMNEVLEFGSFGLMQQEGVFYYQYAMLIDDLEAEPLVKMALAASELVTVLAAEGKENILPLLKGEKSAEQLLQDGVSVVL